MKVWNFKVTVCWAKPVRAGAAMAAAAPDFKIERRLIMTVSVW